MSEVITQAVAALNEKMGGAGFDGLAKFEIDGEGAILIDEGEQNPTAAFMTGKLKVDGDMGLAMKLAGVLS